MINQVKKRRGSPLPRRKNDLISLNPKILINSINNIKDLKIITSIMTSQVEEEEDYIKFKRIKFQMTIHMNMVNNLIKTR